MKFFAYVVCVWALWGCGEVSAPAPEEVELPEGDRSGCMAQAPSWSVEPAWVRTGPANNVVRVDGDVAWVVQSGSNAVGRLSLSDGAWSPDFVDVSRDGRGRNPWDLAVWEGRLYITNLLTDSVTVADAETGAVLGEVTGGGLVAPGGPAAGAGLLVVPGTGFVNPTYGPSQVVVFEILRESPWLRELARLAPSGLNTGSARYDDARGRFYVVSSGARAVDPETGAFGASSEGAVDVLDAALLREGAGERAVVGAVRVPLVAGRPLSGGPRELLIDPSGRYGYLPSSSSPEIYKVDLEALALLRGPSDPILGYVGEGNQLTGLAMMGEGLALVTAFNQDAAYVLDLGCDHVVSGPIRLGTGPLLEGALHVGWDGARQQAVVLMSNTSRVARLRVVR